jgi:arylsulfatase A-like enzyme
VTELSPGRILLLALGFGIWTGILEMVPALAASYVGIVVRLSRDFLWMTPLADVFFFALTGLFLLAVARLWPGASSRRVVMGVFSALATLALGLLVERIHPVAVLLLAAGIGVQVGRWTGGPLRRPRFTHIVSALGLLVVLGLTARMEFGERAFKRYWLNWLPAAPAGAPNVVLLILDTVRGASLDFVDDLRPQSPWEPVHPPTLDSLASRSVLFTRAMATSPWTLPSHESMFTGRWANRLSGESHIGANWFEALDPRIPTLPEVLARYGYLTAGFVGNLVFTSSETGLSRGFLTYEDYEVSPAQILLSSAIGRRAAGNNLIRRVLRYHEVLNRKDARTVADQFLEWQERHADRPFFAFLNFFDAHEPFFPPDSVKEAMAPGDRWDDFSHFVGLLTGATALRNEKWKMTPGEQAAHAAGYHAAILRLDQEVHRLVMELEERGALDNTILIIASDHGEQLGEHDLYSHNNSLYLPALHVPLMILDPRAKEEGVVVRDVVSLRDMAATILDLVGADAGSVGIPGRSLARYWDASGAGLADSGSPEAETAFSVLYRGSENEPWYPVEQGPAMYSLTDSAYHYILRGDGAEELFHLTADPAESYNLAPEAGLGTVLADFRARLSVLAPEAAGAPPPGIGG